MLSLTVQLESDKPIKVEFYAWDVPDDDGVGYDGAYGHVIHDSRPFRRLDDDGVEWDKRKFNDLDNEIIEQYLNENYLELEERLLRAA